MSSLVGIFFIVLRIFLDQNFSSLDGIC